MPDFTHSWAFAFIIGCFIGGIVGFITVALCAASGQASRAEERMIYEAAKREEQRRGLPEDMTSQVEDILGRKIS